MQKLKTYLAELGLQSIPENISESKFVAICDKIKSGESNGWVYGDFDMRHITYFIQSELKFNRLGKSFLV